MSSEDPQQWDVDSAWYAAWSDDQAKRWKNTAVPTGPLISLVMPCHNTPQEFLVDALESIRAQSYSNWQLCLADDGSTSKATKDALARYDKSDRRITLCYLPENRGIAAASNAALAMVRGAFTVPMDHDDLLPPYALAALADQILANPATRFAYSDSDRIDSHGRRCRPFFKPDWNYDLFLAQNYLNHLTAIDTALLRSLGGWRKGYEGSQDYDLYLRVIEHLKAVEILHIPQVLYHWREVAGSVSQTRLGAAVQAARHAIRDHLTRTRRQADVSAPPSAMIYNHIRWQSNQAQADLLLVLIGEPSVAMRELIDNGFSAGSRLAVQIAAIDPELSESKVLAAVNDTVMQASEHGVVMLLNASATVMPEKILLEMQACSLREEAGCVGVKCINAAGRIFSIPEQCEYQYENRRLYAELWSGATATSRGYFAHLLLQQYTDILRPDAVAFRRSRLADYGPLNGHYSCLQLAVADLCMFNSQRGYRNTWIGAASLQFENSSVLARECSDIELSRFREQWKHQISSARFARRDVAWTTTPKP